ncbi:MAG: PAS domain S-box protein [Spirochaetes bacterium]|nr:PAS domain S-box protein [Spirochaetota bacterium]
MKNNPLALITRLFLSTYDDADFIVRQKAKILLITSIIILLVVLPLYMALSFKFCWNIYYRLPVIVLSATLIIVLLVLRKGYFLIAAHSFMIISFIVIWSYFFIELNDSSSVDRMMSIVLVLGLLSFTPLVVDKMKHVIVFYFTANLLTFAVFFFIIHDTIVLTKNTIAAYFVDTTVAIIMSGIISYQIFRINQLSLERARTAEDAIRKSEELFRGVVEESPQIMMIVNHDGSIRFPDEKKTTIFGHARNEITTLERWWKLAYPDGDYRNIIKSEWDNITKQSGKGITAESIETKVQAGDGTTRDVMIRYTSLGGDGRGLILLDDTTNRKIIERHLLASERRYRKLYDSMLDGFVSLDLNGRILEFNTAYQSMTGFSAGELHAKTLWDLTPLKWHDMEKKIIAEQVLARGHSDIFEKEYIKKDGTIFPVELRVYLIQDEEGNNTGMWSIVHDITKRKLTENELLKASKIESLGVFAGGIAHDFNNLLTAIMGNISIAKLDIPDDSKSFEILSEAEKASERARDLTMQLLTFSKGGAPIKKIASIRDLLVDTVDFILRGSLIRSTFSIPKNLWNAEIDEGQISQVIHNLILNAREAMPGGGFISIEAENSTINADETASFKPGKYIVIKITDTGYGINKKQLHKIFDPFFTTKDDGNGLGLSVIYSIVKKHNGYITVASTEGKGTSFSVFLPATERAATPKQPSNENTKLGPGRVLLMDDEEMVLDVGLKILTRLGFSVRGVRDGREAIELYKKAKLEGKPFDLIIMDLTVPGGMGGKEAIGILKTFDPAVKAIVSSGYSNDPVMASYQDFGFCGVVAKPYSIEDLHDTIRQVL